MTEPGAVIHMRRAQKTRQLLDQVVFLVATFGRSKKSNAAWTVLFDGITKTPCHKTDSFFPGYPSPAIAFSLQGRRETLLMVKNFQSRISFGA